MQRKTVFTLAFAVLVLVSTVAATAPAGASTPADVSANASGTQAGTYNGTAFLALADAGDGAVVAGGQRGVENPNATLLRVEDGDVAWTRTFESPNATRVVDVVATESEVYFLQAESPTRPGLFDAQLDLVKTTADGDVVWRQPLNTTAGAGRSVQLVATDEGVTVAHAHEGGVRLAGYASGDAVWERTYGVRAQLQSLHETGDGYLLVGNAGFDNPWVLRTSPSGRERVNETYTGIDAGNVAGGVPTDDGGVLLVGQGRIGFGAGEPSTWAARIGTDDHVRWTRVYDVGSGMRVADVFARDDGVVLVGQERRASGDTDARLVGIGDDGATLFDERVDGPQLFIAATRTGDTVTIAGVTDFGGPRDTDFDGRIDEVSVPDAAAGADGTLEADVSLDSNGTVYRGQDVRFERPYWSGRTYDLVRLPGERDEFDPHAVRRVRLNASGAATVESATLPRGEYALRGADGQYVAVDDGRISGHVDRSAAAFSVRSQRLHRVETNRTFVDVADGERGVSLSFDSDRSAYDVYVTADRRRGEAASAEELRAAFSDTPGFVGVEAVDGRPAARITVDERARIEGERHRNSVGIEADASALDPGLYEVTVGGVDTRDGGAVATGRVVVGTERDRPVGVELGTDSLTVAKGEETRTNVTLTGVTDGISALSLAANRTGEPAVRLRLRTDVNASRASAGSHVSRDEMRTETTDLDGSTPNGSVTVGTLGVEARAFGRESVTNGTNTVTFEVQWVVDENGVPYSVPEERTVSVDVVTADDRSDEQGYGDWFDGVNNYDGTTVDATGQDNVTVTVGAEGNGGNFAFDPPAVRVDPGTTVVWEWSGDGGAHTVTAGDGTFDSGSPAAEAGTTFEHTFEEEGVYTYFCAPHRALGMKGAVVVGETDVDDGSGRD